MIPLGLAGSALARGPFRSGPSVGVLVIVWMALRAVRLGGVHGLRRSASQAVRSVRRGLDMPRVRAAAVVAHDMVQLAPSRDRSTKLLVAPAVRQHGASRPIGATPDSEQAVAVRRVRTQPGPTISVAGGAIRHGEPALHGRQCGSERALDYAAAPSPAVVRVAQSPPVHPAVAALGRACCTWAGHGPSLTVGGAT